MSSIRGILNACGSRGRDVRRLSRIAKARRASFQHRALSQAADVIILALLLADLFAYRGVPAARSMASGRLTADWLGAFGVTGWWKPLAQATSYLLNVWHATMLGILLSGLALTVLPAICRHT